MEMEVEVEQTGMGRAWSGGARARFSPPRLLWGALLALTLSPLTLLWRLSAG